MTIWSLHCTKSELKLVEHFGKCHWVPHQLNSGTIRVNLELEPFSLSLFFSFHFCRPDGLSESVTLNDGDNIGHTFCLSSKALIQRLKWNQCAWALCSLFSSRCQVHRQSNLVLPCTHSWPVGTFKCSRWLASLVATFCHHCTRTTTASRLLYWLPFVQSSSFFLLFSLFSIEYLLFSFVVLQTLVSNFFEFHFLWQKQHWNKELWFEVPRFSWIYIKYDDCHLYNMESAKWN